MTRRVRIEVRDVGQAFGCYAVLRDARTGRYARTGRRIVETQVVPYGMRGVAYQRGLDLAARHGWTVVDGDES